MPFSSESGPTIGFATIGQTPRSDLVPYLVNRLSKPVTVLEGGVLDDLDSAEIAGLQEDSGLHMVTRLRDGSSARLSYRNALPRMQQVVDDLVTQGADLIVIVCGADWSDIRADVPVLNPGRVFPATVESLAGNSRLAVIKPDAAQVEVTAAGLKQRGVDAAVTHAFPYDDNRLQAAREAAGRLRELKPQLVWMSCVGMDEDMRDTVAEELGLPVILARTLLAGLIDNLLP